MLITTDTILDFLQERVEQKQPIPPDVWLESAGKLNVLIGDEHDRYWALRQEVAKQQSTLVENRQTVARAKLAIEATDIYREMRQQESKISRIEEHIRIAKKFATLKSDEIKGYSL